MSFSQNLARLKMSDRQQTRPHEGSRWGNFRRAGRKGKSEKPLERKTGVLAKDWPWAGHASEARKQCHMSSKLKNLKKIKNWEKEEEETGDRHPLFLKKLLEKRLRWRKLENGWKLENWKAGFAGREGAEGLRGAAQGRAVKEPRGRAACTNRRPPERPPKTRLLSARPRPAAQTGAEDPALVWCRGLAGLRGGPRVAHRVFRRHLHRRIPLKRVPLFVCFFKWVSLLLWKYVLRADILENIEKGKWERKVTWHSTIKKKK